jgi:hypothetical protein
VGGWTTIGTKRAKDTKGTAFFAAFRTLLWGSRFKSLRHDLDDTRQAQYGVYYTQKRPLTLAALESEPGI